jgi:hypothetical protein
MLNGANKGLTSRKLYRVDDLASLDGLVRWQDDIGTIERTIQPCPISSQVDVFRNSRSFVLFEGG